VQLRTPKLSKDFKPTVIYEIMENSLQPLSEDDLRPMSEAIENMDNIKSRLEELKEGKKAAERVKSAFDRYNLSVIQGKAKAFLESKLQVDKLNNSKTSIIKEIERAETSFREAEEEIRNLDIMLKTSEAKKKELDEHDSVRIREKMVNLELEIKELIKEKNDKEVQLQGKKENEIEVFSKIKETENENEQSIKKLEEILCNMDDSAEQFYFDEQDFLKDELKKDLNKEYKFYYINDALKKYTIAIDNAIKALLEEERKNREYDNSLEELEKSKRDKEDKNRFLEQTIKLLSEIKQEYIEKVYSFRKENKEFLISDEALIKISQKVEKFDDTNSFDLVLEPIRKEYNEFSSKLNEMLYEMKNEKVKWSKKGEEKKKEIDEWKAKKDPEPLRSEKVILNRENLVKEGIPFIPLYKAVDFNDNIDESLKGIIEEALMDMGLLDALIIPEKYKKKVMELNGDGADKYIFAEPNFLAYDLSQFLKVEKIEEKGIERSYIENVLKGVLLDESSSGTYINEKGIYGIGILKGKVTSSYCAKFIGTAARKKYREEQIEKLLLELKEIEGEINNYTNKINEINLRIEELSREFKNIPSNKDILVAIKEEKTAQFNFDRSNEEVIKKSQVERSLYEELKKIKEKVYECTFKLPIKGGIEVFKEALEAAYDYKDELHELEKVHFVILKALEKHSMLKSQLENIQTDLDNLLYDINLKDRKIREAEINLNNLKKQLSLSDYEAIKLELDECIKLIREIPDKKIIAVRKSENEKSNIIQNKNQLLKLEEDFKFYEKLKGYNESFFIEEYELGYVFQGNEEKDYYKIAKKIIKDETDSKLIKDTEEYANLLFQRFQENNQYLREYNIKTLYIFDSIIEEENKDLIKNLNGRKRIDILAKVRGKDVDFYKLLEFIIEGIEENEKLLRESDRQLFEDILVKNISKKIRAKIFHSEKWVKNMNELMESMNTSSGLSFSLKWSNKKAEAEGQMDTKYLVELLKQDGNLMREEDLNRLSEHFRSKITEARRSFEDKGQSQTFHSIMREILDYRKWFEFKLSFVKTGQNKKELTNNAFFQFSGGEKAMAMYVPLFSAVFARYEGGRKDCPRLISLDEAFAGVDEQNISDMFRLLGELGLDYVINSQILWGDYATVPSLSICELIRPDNASFVTVIRYNWNGKIKELVV
jgi:uncharacterized protein (TIGR02680 family)